MKDFSFKKIIGYLFFLLILYLVAGFVAEAFGRGLYIFTGIDLYYQFSILHKIFFGILILIAVFREKIVAWFLSLAHRDVEAFAPTDGADDAPLWQKILLLLAAAAFFHLRLSQAFLAFANYYANRDDPFFRVNYTAMSSQGALVFFGISLVLAALLLLLLHKSRLTRAVAPILALVCGGLALLSLLWSGSTDIFSAESVVKQFSPLSFPDTGVLMWALPALVLAHFGNRSETLRNPNRWAKICAYGAVALSCTFVGDLLGFAGAFLSQLL